MKLLKPKIEDYPGRLIELKIDNPNLDFAEAKDIAKQKVEETGGDPMLLSWAAVLVPGQNRRVVSESGMRPR